MNKSTNQPTAPPIGVVQSLSSGFDLVTRRPGLMLLPILLDVFLWLGPHLSAYPLFRALIDFVQSLGTVAMDATARQQAEALQKLLDQLGQAFNLFSWLSPALLGVPSLMAGATEVKAPGGAPTTWQVGNGLTFVALFFAFSLAGLALSSIYWGMLASQLRGGGLDLGRVLTLWWRLIQIAVFLVGIVLVIGFSVILVGAFVAMFSPTAAQFLILLGTSALFWVLFYLAFTIHGVALRDASVSQAARTSVALIRLQFFSAMGLVLAAIAIYLGMGLVWNIPPSDSWLKAAGILGHAFVATGLAMATALYYLDRTQPASSSQ